MIHLQFVSVLFQLLLQGVPQNNQGQLPAQLITIRRQVNTLPIVTAKKSLLVGKSNASKTQIMPLGIAETGNNVKHAFVSTVIKTEPQESIILPTSKSIILLIINFFFLIINVGKRHWHKKNFSFIKNY